MQNYADIVFTLDNSSTQVYGHGITSEVLQSEILQKDLRELIEKLKKS